MQKITFRDFNSYAYLLILTYFSECSVRARESLRGLTTSKIQKELDSVVESFISSMSLIVAAFFVSFLLQAPIPYPYSPYTPFLHRRILFFLAAGSITIAGYLYHSVPRPVAKIDSALKEEKTLVADAIEVEDDSL